jgi:hypothetical protein
MTFHSSPEKKRAASKSRPPTFQAKKSKAEEESKGPNQISDPPAERYWNQKLDFILRDTTRFMLWDF